MNYAIIGTGNMAWFMGHVCAKAGFHCRGIYGRDEKAAHTLADAIGTQTFSPADDLPEETDMVVLAVSDRAIQTVAATLRLPRHTVLVHTSGMVSGNVLRPITPDYGVVWPVYSIQKHMLPQHRNIPCAWEASSANSAGKVQQLIHSFSDRPFLATAQQRQWLHLAAVLGNNFINHLMAISAQICTAEQLPFFVLKPLLEQTFGNIERQNPFTAQTGPARRGDQATIQKHLEMLAHQPAWQNIYAGLSASIEKMYRETKTEKEWEN
jgi:predicted short-subunit dehydrogenase-like oxidoreductase (DUF2520 family)